MERKIRKLQGKTVISCISETMLFQEFYAKTPPKNKATHTFTMRAGKFAFELACHY